MDRVCTEYAESGQPASKESDAAVQKMLRGWRPPPIRRTTPSTVPEGPSIHLRADNKDRQVAPKQMQLGARFAVNTHNMGGRFVESVKNARWSMRPQEAGDGLESMVEFQVQIKGHSKREYEDKWQGWQNLD